MRICGHLSPSCLAAEQVVESGQPVLWDCGTPCPVRPLYGAGTPLAGNSPLDTGSLAKSLLWGIRLLGHRLCGPAGAGLMGPRDEGSGFGA